MQTRVDAALIHSAVHGEGAVLVALHGAGVDHREMAAAIEAVVPEEGYRRVYPDLPGMGRSTAAGLQSNDDVVVLLASFLERLGAPVLLLGHSYGAYLAREVAARRPDLVRGLALVCPIGIDAGRLPAHEVVASDAAADAELEPERRAGFAEYFVVRTPATARRYRAAVVPGIALADGVALERIFSGWEITPGGRTFAGPTLIVAGRRDATAGFEGAVRLAAEHPRATVAVLENAGHALPHEQPELFGALLRDWLARVGG